MLGYISRQTSSARTEVTDINFCTHKSTFTSLDQDDRNQEATEFFNYQVQRC